MADNSGGGIPQPYYLHPPSAVVGAGDVSMFLPSDAFAPPPPPLQFPHSGVSGRATAAPAPVAVEAPRRKRGRPRKYGPPSTTSSLPSSSSSPAAQRKKAPSPSSLLSSPSSSAAASASPRKKLDASTRAASQKPNDALGLRCQGFTPHTICVEDGEDVAQKILSLTHKLKQSVCIISASGSVCDVSLRQPANTGGLVLYEGLFEIVSFSGSLLYMVTGSGTSTRRGGMSICLIGSDGRMIGGGVGGSLKAAGPVQVIASSFLIDQAILSTPEEVESSNISSNSDIVATRNLMIPAARQFDDYQLFGGGGNFVQHLQPSNAPLRSTDWQGSAGLEHIGAYNSQEGGD